MSEKQKQVEKERKAVLQLLLDEAVRVGQGAHPQSGGLQARLPVPPALYAPVQEGGRHDTE